jgi:hypothetical protein
MWAAWDIYMSDFGVGFENWNVCSSENADAHMMGELFGYEFDPGTAW